MDLLRFDLSQTLTQLGRGRKKTKKTKSKPVGASVPSVLRLAAVAEATRESRSKQE